MPRSVILYWTHYTSEALLQRFAELRDSCTRPDRDVVLLYDVSNGPCPAPPDVRVWGFDRPRIRGLGLDMTDEHGGLMDIMPCYNDYVILKFYLDNPDYDYYWFMEYDVRYTGEWHDFFDAWDHSTADMLGTYILRYHVQPDWIWWSSFKHPSKKIEKEDMIRTFLPVGRVSRRAWAFLHQEYRDGWSGEYEVRLPTLLHRAGYVIEDYGGAGEFVAPGNLDRHYLGGPTPAVAPPGGTFRYRPIMTSVGSTPNKLWHPVKDVVAAPQPGPARQLLRRVSKLIRPD